MTILMRMSSNSLPHGRISIASGYRALAVDGRDAGAFLQAQLSADLAPSAQRVVYSAWCNARGQVRALLHVCQREPGRWLLLYPAEYAEALRKLRMFILRAQVQLQPLPTPAAWLGPAPPPADAALVRIDPWRALLLDTAGEEAGAGMDDARPAGGDGADGAAHFALLGALRGEPQWPAAQAETQIPQSLGLREGFGLSLRKGCYPGQEIISRVHYRGRPPRRLHSVVGPAPAAEAFYRQALPGAPELILSQALRPHGGD